MSAVTASNAATAANGSSSNINAASTSAVAPANNNNGATKPAVQPSEVGWLFVTQYYTFLNQNPARLHCFFTKKSTMVHGTEQEESSPCFGQQQIHDKITSLNFQDAKVFVSNVDSQSSASGGILVQVLGELSNNGGAWRKFAQTFFLAEQPNGYFVLNDIFRYLKDEDEIEAEAEALDEAIQDEIDEADKNGVEVPHHIEVNNIGNANAMPKLPSSTAAASGAKAIESAESKSSTAAASVAQAESAHTSAAPALVDQAVATSSKAEPTQADADQVGVDKKVTVVDADQAPVAAAPAAAKGGAAKDAAAAAKTETAPAAAASAPAAAAPAQPTGPPKPKTWATLAASDATRWGSNVSTEAKGVSSSRPTPAASTPAKPAAAGGARPAAAAAAGAASPSVYIKNVVADQVNDASLRQALEAFGTVKDLQIIAQRSCAFAEFTSVDGARKAAAKGSVAVGKNGWNVQIEERRKNAAAGAGAGGAGGRGGAAVRGGAGAGRGGAGGAGGRGGAQRGGSGRPSAGGAPRAGAN
ncbi:hypothetical protein NDA16_004518 [Ustilago loliicola]|nr:hypothetical protein NDA16_004518 [Ustilago loliicola]